MALARIMGGAASTATTAVRLVAVCAFLALAAGCATDDQLPAPTPKVTLPEAPPAFEPLDVEQDGPTKVAVLLPFSGPHARLGRQLWDAASLALFDHGDRMIELLPRDTKGTPSGAAAAAQTAIEEGAHAIIGPLFSTSVAAVRPVLVGSGVRTVALSNTRTAAGDPMFLIGNHPESQIDSLVSYLTAENRRRVAMLGPDTHYLRLLRSRLIEADKTGRIDLVEVRLYRVGDSYTEIAKQVRKLTQYDERSAALREFVGLFRKAWESFDDEHDAMQSALDTLSQRMDAAELLRAAYADSPQRRIGWTATEEDYSFALTALQSLYRQKLGSAGTSKEAMAEALAEFELQETLGDAELDAVILPFGGQPLLVIAPMFEYFNAAQPRVWLVGTDVWDSPGIDRARDLFGSRYVTASSPNWLKFRSRMESVFRYTPDRLATAAYDAVTLAIEAKRATGVGRFDPGFLTREDGFVGVDGKFWFLPDGTNKRTLHVVQLRADGRRNVFTWLPQEPAIDGAPVAAPTTTPPTPPVTAPPTTPATAPTTARDEPPAPPTAPVTVPPTAPTTAPTTARDEPPAAPTASPTAHNERPAASPDRHNTPVTWDWEGRLRYGVIAR